MSPAPRTSYLADRSAWQAITAQAKRARRAPAVVAVPWVTNAELLHLGRGDRVVVDFSDQAIAAGQTNPSEVLTWIRRGARIRSMAQLHAKVFIFGRTAYVGSTNVSLNSALRLNEATVRTTEPTAVAAARHHVEALFDAAAPVTKAAAEAAQSRYRPARAGGPLGQQPDSLKHQDLGRVWRMHFESPATPSEQKVVESRRTAVAADHGLGTTDLNFKVLPESIGQRVKANDLFIFSIDHSEQGWWAYAEWVLATERLPRGWTLVWTTEDTKLGTIRPARANRVLAELGLPALSRWGSHQLSAAKGKDLVARLWPKARLRSQL